LPSLFGFSVSSNIQHAVRGASPACPDHVERTEWMAWGVMEARGESSDHVRYRAETRAGEPSPGAVRPSAAGVPRSTRAPSRCRTPGVHRAGVHRRIEIVQVIPEDRSRPNSHNFHLRRLTHRGTLGAVSAPARVRRPEGGGSFRLSCNALSTPV